MSELIKRFYDFTIKGIDESGLRLPSALLARPDGSLIMLALMVGPDRSYQAILSTILQEDIREAIFALDRYTRPGQGTHYADVLAGHYYHRDEDKTRSVFDPDHFEPFIIEYQIEPRIVDPICWDNAFWTEALENELQNAMNLMKTSLR